MKAPGQRQVDVIFTADAVDPASMAGRTVLVVDVLRASTTIITALTNGCLAVVPVADAAEARARAGALGPGVLLAGERRGETIEGFDIGNSPTEVTRTRVAGRVLVFTTSNGTRALLAARRAPAVGVAALVNLGAAAAWALAEGRGVAVLCSGERGRRSLEDFVCAGLLVERVLAERPDADVTPAAREALAAGRTYAKDVGRLRDDSSWARHLVTRGRGADVAACLKLDASTLVPRYRPDVDKVVAPPR